MKFGVAGCKVCGDEFVKKSSTHAICSPSCKEEYELKYRETRMAADYCIFLRDNFRCVYCGRSPIEDGARLTVDHVFPKSLGGPHNIFNTVTACWECNTKKNVALLTPEIYTRIIKEISKRNGGISKATQIAIQRIFTERWGLSYVHRDERREEARSIRRKEIRKIVRPIKKKAPHF